ncbi:Hypothetical protein PHPALM_14134 [Phytophthora palmivora]|uniref:Uncharacterized protein n=1 Tax=Phytophthora palmivora TaxID=4796 RepID=A0A2P4XVT2_9STRA|nr:Hypothetical protein PHPALM_14134 [Phytophthora palmivora]
MHEMRRLSWQLAHVQRHLARPRYDLGKKRYFDGKIGIWPIVELAVVQRALKNRAKGAPITKNISMTRATYTKMPREKQDNTGPHVQDDNADIVEAGQKVLGTVIACKGGNNYIIPRSRKFHMRHGISPIALPVADSAVAEHYRHLRQLQCVA